jgi:aryl-alcohol dehydrogenase
MNGLTVKGVIEGDSQPQTFLPELVELFTAGRLPFDRFVTRYRLDQINEAINDAHSGKCVKAVLTID